MQAVYGINSAHAPVTQKMCHWNRLLNAVGSWLGPSWSTDQKWFIGILHALSSAGIHICSSFWQPFDFAFISLKVFSYCIFTIYTYMYAVAASPSLKYTTNSILSHICFIGFLNKRLLVACHLLIFHLKITGGCQHHVIITVNRNNTAGELEGLLSYLMH